MKEEGGRMKAEGRDTDRSQNHPSSFRLHPSDFPAAARAHARIIVGYPWWLRPFLARDVVAITLGRRIYLRDQLEGPSYERLIRHELAHVAQVDRLGLLVFLWRYVTEFARNWVRLRSTAAAYAAISFEIEARAAEEADSGNGL